MQKQDLYKQTARCPKCGKQIAKLNFEIHQAMCKGARQSFIFNVNDPEFQKKFSVEQENIPQIPPPSISEKRQHQADIEKRKEEAEKKEYKEVPKPNMHKQEEKKPQRIPSSQQKFPCSYCGYKMSMAELDTHPLQCIAHAKNCPYCRGDYPEQLMEEHKKVCDKRPREPVRPPQEQPRISPRTNPSNQPRQQLNRNETFSPTTTHRRVPIVRQQRRTVSRNGRNFMIIRRTDANGRVSEETRQIRGREDDQDQEMRIFIASNPFAQIFFGGMRNQRQNERQNSRNPHSLEQFVLQLMQGMRINRQQNPGMSEAQISKVPVVKFDKNTNGKKCPNCTICIKDYNDGDVLMKLPCGHLFNQECLVPWLKNSAVCPNCRGTARSNQSSRT